MSRVGKLPIKIPSGVKVEVKGSEIKVEGPKGKLNHRVPRGVMVTMNDGELNVTRDESLVPNAPALHGLTRSLVYNMVHGVSTGFEKKLEIIGVGYRAQAKGSMLTLNVGYSHPIDYKLPEGIQAKVEANTKLTVSGFDKVLVGMVAAKIRSFRKPEPYQGKGIKYADERIIRKQGKAAAK